MSRVRAPYPTPLIGGSGITPGPPRLFHFGMSPSGKAQDFDSCIRAFEPRHPSQCGLALPARRSDSVAQQAEQLPFKQWVRGSNPRWVTKKRKPVIRWDCGFFFVFQCFAGFRQFQKSVTYFNVKRVRRIFRDTPHPLFSSLTLRARRRERCAARRAASIPQWRVRPSSRPARSCSSGTG